MTTPIEGVTASAAVRHWTLVLDEFERRLNAQEAAIESGFSNPSPPPSFIPPAGVPPLPDDMRTRANALVDRNDVLIQKAQQVAITQHIVDPATRARRTRPVTATSSSSTLDLRA